MKKIPGLILIAVFMSGVSGCGNNETKQKLVGTDVVTSSTAGGSGVLSASANPTASSVSTLYKAAFFGAGVGAVTASPRLRLASNRVSAATGGLPAANVDGEYIINDVSGMRVSISFRYRNLSVIQNMSNVTNGIYIRAFYEELITSTELDITEANITRILERFSNPAGSFYNKLYVPAMWCYNDSGAPIGFCELKSGDITDASSIVTLTAKITNFLTATFPDSMVNKVTGSVPGAAVNLTLTCAMQNSFPTNTVPASMSGTGTLTLTTGEVLTVTESLLIGSNGPIGGTMSFTSSTGETGTMTFSADGSMAGTVSKSGTAVATVTISSSGTGTYVDLKTGKTYSITGAKPS